MNNKYTLEKIDINKVSIIAFDADDTLWYDSIYYRKLIIKFIELASNFQEKKVVEQLLSYELEIKDIGEIGFINAIIATATKIIPTDFQDNLNSIINDFITHPIELIPDVNKLLTKLNKHRCNFELICLTKGVEKEQIKKIQTSGLQNHFSKIICFKKKTNKEYLSFFRKEGLLPSKILMIGNSLKHDILPILEIGGQAIWFNHDLNLYGSNAKLPKKTPTIKNYKSLINHVRSLELTRKSNFVFASSNIEKYNFFQFLIQSGSVFTKFKKITFHKFKHGNEGGNAKKNAISKAIEVSRNISNLIISTDDELIFESAFKSFEPKAKIKRIISENPTDAQIFKYYNNILNKSNDKQIRASLKTHIAITFNGNLIATYVIKSIMVLKYRENEKWLPSRPLSGLHYIPQFKKFYTELSLSEKQNHYQLTGNSLIKFLNSII